MAMWALVRFYALVLLRGIWTFAFGGGKSSISEAGTSGQFHKQGHKECCEIKTLEFLRIFLGSI